MRRFSLLAFAVLVLIPGAVRGTPSNDKAEHATMISALPFADAIDHSSATREPLEQGCFGPVDLLNTPTVWFRYVAGEDDVLLASTHRYFGARAFPIFRESGDDLHLIACGEASVDDNDFSFARFPVEAGASYLIQISGPPEDPRPPFGLTFFHLDRAERNDVGISDVRVDAVDPVADPIHAAWNRRVTWNTSFPGRANQEVEWKASSCPRGSLIGCSEVASGRYRYADFPARGACCDWFYWNDHGCLGDVDLRVVLDLRFAVDTDSSNNSATTTVQVLASDPDIGVCPLP